MGQIFSNNASSFTEGALLVSTTSMTLGSATGFPQPATGEYYFLTITEVDAGSGRETDWEVVKVTARTGNVISIVRGQDDTDARAWAAFSPVQLRLTKAGLTPPDNVAITSGTIDGTVIGASQTAAGSFSSVATPSAAITGGSINNTTVGATNAAAGKFTSVHSSTLVGTGVRNVTVNADGSLSSASLDPEIADGTVANNTLRWSSTAWVQTSILQVDATSVDVTGSFTVSANSVFSGTVTTNSLMGSGGQFRNYGANQVASNTIFGNQASAVSSSSATTTTAFGYDVLRFHNSGNANTAIGYKAMRQDLTGSNNVAIGYDALENGTASSGSTAVGTFALTNSSASRNIGIGYGAGAQLASGSNNTIIGDLDGTSSMTNTLLIGTGITERVKVTNTEFKVSGTAELIKVDSTDGLYINGAAFGSGASLLPSANTWSGLNTFTGGIDLQESDYLYWGAGANRPGIRASAVENELDIEIGGTNRLVVNDTGIDVTGNIVVSGNVDGRDVAADGAKAVAAHGWGNHAGLYATTSSVSSQITTAIGTKLNSNAVSTYGLSLIDDATAAAARTTLGLGTAATTAASAYATSSQVLTNVPSGALFTDTEYSLPFTDNSTNWNTAYGWGDHAGLYTANVGTITGVTAGTGLTGTATSGAATLNVIGGSGITASANDIAVDSTVLRTTGIQTRSADLAFSSGKSFYVVDSGTTTGRIPAPGGGLYTGSPSGVIGAFKIKLPIATVNNSSMISFEVHIFDYTIRESVNLRISGYAYNSSGTLKWTNQTVTILSAATGRDYTVRFGNDSTGHCLWIGEVDSTWSYPKVGIFNLMVGHSAVLAEFASGWVITLVGETPGFDTVEDTISGNLPYGKLLDDSVDGSKITDDAIDSEHYVANSIDALHLNVSGNGTNTQFLRSDGDGTMSWVTPPDTVDPYEFPYTVSSDAGNSSVVQRTSAGYIKANYFNTTPNTVSSGVTQVCVETGNDGYIRHGTAAAIRTFLGVAAGANNYSLPSSVITSSSTQSNQLTIRNASPTINLRDTNQRGTHLHTNDAKFYILGATTTDSTTYAQQDGHWPFYISMTTNNANFGGTITAASNITAYSDARIKDNVETIDGALEKVTNMRGVYYNRNDLGEEENAVRRTGVIAQEIEKVLPEVVRENEEKQLDENGITLEGGRKRLTVDYGNIVGILIEAIKEQQVQIDELKGN
jgi:hypothetical protein